MRRLPPLNALRCFESSARLGSFARAAEELFVTASAVSHQIKSLETFLDLKLFQRTGRQVSLTAAGERYLPAISHALDEIDSATRRLMTNPNAAAVTLSVAPAFLTRWLMPRLMHFQEQQPDVELRLSASMDAVDFQHTDIDMAVRYGDGRWSGVEAIFLLGMAVVPVCSPRLLKGRHPLNTPADLQHHTLIHVSTRMDEWRTWLRAAGEEEAISSRGLRFSSTSLATNAAMEGLGIALMDRHLIGKELRDRQLVVPFDIELETQGAFYLVYPRGRSLTYGMRAFHDWILQALQSDVLAEAEGASLLDAGEAPSL